MTTVTSYEIGNDWVDLNTLTGIPVGSGMRLQNTGLAQDVIQGAISDFAPPSDFSGVFMKQITPMYRVTEGEGRVWVRLYRYDRTQNKLTKARLQVQVI